MPAYVVIFAGFGIVFSIYMILRLRKDTKRLKALIDEIDYFIEHGEPPPDSKGGPPS